MLLLAYQSALPKSLLKPVVNEFTCAATSCCLFSFLVVADVNAPALRATAAMRMNFFMLFYVLLILNR